jgi:hypothetical protein
MEAAFMHYSLQVGEVVVVQVTMLAIWIIIPTMLT